MTPEITARVLAVALLGAAVAACASDPAPRVVAGTLVSPTPSAGAAMENPPGTPPNNSAAAPVTRGAIGGMIGTRIGAALDDEDKRRAYAAQVQALESGTSGAPVAWRNPDSGRYGSVVPGPKYQSNGADCRQFTHTIYLDGKPQTARGAACRGADGAWQAG
jgi:surface antigen